MAFRSLDTNRLIKFNSSASAEFLSLYQNILDTNIRMNAESMPHQTFAASSIRCDRISWFRIRGVQPDKVVISDRQLDFTAQIGTHCHQVIQTNLKRELKDDWVDVSTYLQNLSPDYQYSVHADDHGLETQVVIDDPPIRFSCDGIIKYKNTYYLLEIKTSDFQSWSTLSQPKPQHIDQVKCYATLLNIHNVLFLYQDRQYGDFKCFEVTIKDADMQYIWNKIKHVMELVQHNIAPDPLPSGDSWCTASMCPYYKKCSEYGR